MKNARDGYASDLSSRSTLIRKRADLAKQREADQAKMNQAWMKDSQERLRGNHGAQSELMKKWQTANKIYKEDK